MLVNCFIKIIFFAIISLFLCFFGVIITFFLQGEKLAIDLFNSWVFKFNGILVGGTGYGLMWFVISNGKNFITCLTNIIDIPQEKSEVFLIYVNRINSFYWQHIICIPLLIIGAFVLWNCEYPLYGFAKYYLAIMSISLYYVASYILSFFIYVLLIFMQFEKKITDLSLKKTATPYEIDSFNSFFIIVSFFGILAIYFGLRGTLTANFVFTNPDFKKFLILPILLYLPATLLFSFYPRYVLRKIFDFDLLKKIQDLEKHERVIGEQKLSLKEKLNMEKLLLEIKEKLLLEKSKIPIFSLKDSPSILMLLIILLNIIVQKDSVISNFLKFLW